MRLRVVLDTNVLVAGIKNASGAPGAIVGRAFRGEFVVLFNSKIMAEYKRILLLARFNFAKEEVRGILSRIRRVGRAVRRRSKPLRVALPDPKDRPFMDAGVAGKAHAIVTKNVDDFPIECGVPIYTPVAFLRRLESL